MPPATLGGAGSALVQPLLTDEVLALAAELEALVGGDARVGQANITVKIRPSAPGLVTIVDAEEVDGSLENNVVLVHDPRCPPNTPEAQAAPRTSLASRVTLKSPLMRTETKPSAEATVNRSRRRDSFSAF